MAQSSVSGLFPGALGLCSILSGAAARERRESCVSELPQVPHSQPASHSRLVPVYLMSFCNYLGLLVCGQPCDRLTAIGGEHEDTRKMKAVAVISQHVSRGGPDQQVDGKGSREKALNRTVVPVGWVVTSLDVREQGGSIGSRTKVLSINN